ncbi:MAG: histidine phosphatase family protein [Alphaproteobacteria bacterium]|nr:histidine phosphatase family protein [Alphaproteobacteria bacterium]
MNTGIVTRWWWIRHAPVINPSGRIYGATDVPADTTDEMSFRVLARLLPQGAQWVTSHLRRAKETAAALRRAGADVPAKPLIDPHLGEQSFGAWHGRTYAEIEREVGIHRFWLAPARHRPPEGESFVDLVERVVPAIERLTAGNRGRDIVCVAHGGTIRAAVGHALLVDPESALRISTANLGLTRLDHIGEGGGPGAWRVAWINQQTK